MKLMLFRHLWGVDEAWETFFPKAKKAGYQGIETGVPQGKDRAKLKKLLKDNGLKLIAGIYTGGHSATEHAESFEAQLADAVSLDPVLVNSHSGKDYFKASENSAFFSRALKAEQKAGVKVAHETHRGRVLYNPWVTRDILAEFPELSLNFDLSHWVCIAERLLETEGEIIKTAAKRCIHIHARVGYEEGPQVPDPRAPEYQRALLAHEAWWDMAWAAQKAKGEKVSTLTPEFGPPDYMHTLPYTNAPVADLNAICDWQAMRQAARFTKKYGR